MLLETSQLVQQVVKDTIPAITSIIRDTVYVESSNSQWIDLPNLVSIVTALIAIISVIVSNQSTKKQLEISERQLKETTDNFKMQLEADRAHMKDDNMIKMRKEWIQEFSDICCAVSELLYKFTNRFRGIKDGKIEKIKENLIAEIDELQLLDSQLKLKITLEGEELTALRLIFDDFLKYIYVDETLDALELRNKLISATLNFEKESQDIIKAQVAKLVE